MNGGNGERLRRPQHPFEVFESQDGMLTPFLSIVRIIFSLTEGLTPPQRSLR